MEFGLSVYHPVPLQSSWFEGLKLGSPIQLKHFMRNIDSYTDLPNGITTNRSIEPIGPTPNWWLDENLMGTDVELYQQGALNCAKPGPVRPKIEG